MFVKNVMKSTMKACVIVVIPDTARNVEKNVLNISLTDVTL
ncbi:MULTISPECIES: hypothetical protein [Dorea]|nr:hypothetical protein [Dorea sp. Marseille-P4042]